MQEQYLEEHSLKEKNPEACILLFHINRKKNIQVIGKIYRKDKTEIEHPEKVRLFLSEVFTKVLDNKSLYHDFIVLLDCFGYIVKFELNTKDINIYNLLSN